MRLPAGVPCFILASLLTRNINCPSLERVMRLNSGSPACSIAKRGSRISDLPPIRSRSVFQLFAVWRIGEHEIEFARRECVLRKRRPKMEVPRLVAFTF